MGKLILQYRDHGEVGERSTASFEGPDVLEVNIASETALMNALVDAVDAVVLGTRIKQTRQMMDAAYPDTPPISKFAQRENKWLVRYRDTVTGHKGSITIPTADLDLLPSDGDKLDITAGAGLALKQAIDNYVLSPGTGTRGDTEVYEITFVGRNL